MKKFAASVGLVALGASALNADALPNLDSATKPWSASATLRGFYDDNVSTISDKDHQDSFGFELSPSIGLNWSPDPTTRLVGGYIFSMKYYDRKPLGETDHVDMTHTLSLALDHAFSERYQVRAVDSFVIGQEPDTLRSGNAFSTFQRIPGDNIRNFGSIDLNGQLTPLLGFQAGYANSYFDYSASGPGSGPLGEIIPSPSGVLDRDENMIHLDSRWTIKPETTAIVGGQFRAVNYTADEIIGEDLHGPVFSDSRDFREYYLYVGADHTFRPDLTASARIGGRYIDFYNAENNVGTGFGPYASLSGRWVYTENSYVELGLTEDISSTDFVGAQDGTTRGFTSSAETTVVYGSVNHQITSKLRGSLLGQFQNSSFKGGSFDGDTEHDYLLGLNLTYQFDPHFSTELGYNYDRLDSDVPGRNFDRNRVYIGVTASY
ncbi:MAG TPA: outer membrane beta-barrel protein [Verrucomicrobiae bacterium]|nr:outer membrane beta-barrel protein [Verrucomicrobiae bacterium]